VIVFRLQSVKGIGANINAPTSILLPALTSSNHKENVQRYPIESLAQSLQSPDSGNRDMSTCSLYCTSTGQAENDSRHIPVKSFEKFETIDDKLTTSDSTRFKPRVVTDANSMCPEHEYSDNAKYQIRKFNRDFGIPKSKSFRGVSFDGSQRGSDGFDFNVVSPQIEQQPLSTVSRSSYTSLPIIALHLPQSLIHHKSSAVITAWVE